MKCRISLLFMVSLGLVMTQALPAAEPVAKVPEKKIAIPEEPVLKKEDITESSPAIAVEEAEEPKQADRAKKSASTTFCVEIRPGPSEAPVKVCENQPPPPAPIPQVPQEAHEVHEHPPPPPPPPTYIQEPQNPVFIIPPNPSEILIPNEPFPPQIPQQSYLHFPQIFQPPPPPPPPQQVLIPSVPSNPCPQQTIVIPGSAPNPYPSQPSVPQQTIVIPGSAPNYPAPSAPQTIVIPGYPHPYPQSPCPPSPCAAAGAGIHPHAMLALFRSAMAPMNSLSSLNGMEMRSNNDQANMEYLKEAPTMDFLKETSGMNSGDAMTSKMESGDASARMESGDAMVSKMDPNEDVETVGTPFPRTHIKKPLGQQPSSYPLYSSSYNQRSPYVIRCNPQVLAFGNGGSAYVVAGRGRSSEMNLMDSNGQPMMTADGPLAMGIPQARHHVIQPVVQPYIAGGGYSSHSVVPSVVQHTTYQSIPSTVDSYPVHQHSVIPGYSVHHRQPSVIVPSISINSHPGVIAPGHSSGGYRMGNDQQRYQQAQEKSWNSEAEQRASMDQQMRSQQYSAMSPSRMLDQMRGNSASSGFVKRPMMQSFPRVSEEKSNGPCHTAKINIPRGASFVISEANDMDEKNSDKDDVAIREDTAKRETEKSATEKKN